MRKCADFWIVFHLKRDPLGNYSRIFLKISLKIFIFECIPGLFWIEAPSISLISSFIFPNFFFFFRFFLFFFVFFFSSDFFLFRSLLFSFQFLLLLSEFFYFIFFTNFHFIDLNIVNHCKLDAIKSSFVSSWMAIIHNRFEMREKKQQQQKFIYCCPNFKRFRHANSLRFPNLY